jgi:hypothetical protein
VDVKDQIDDNAPIRVGFLFKPLLIYTDCIQEVYGMSEARDYAWKYMKINTKIVSNGKFLRISNICNCKISVEGTDIQVVENYVWYFVDKMYGNQWGWTGDGSSYPKSKRQLKPRDDFVELGNDPVDASALPTPTWPENCHGSLPTDIADTSALVCDYVNPPDPDTASSSAPAPPPPKPPVATLPPDPKNCNCNESGCTPVSPSCCGNGTC